MHRVRVISLAVVSCLLAAGLLIAAPEASAQTHKSGQFTGPKANTGFVTHSKNSAKNVLTLSDDFQVPDTPDPHWQVVDSRGNAFLLDRLTLKADRVAKSITLPAGIRDVAKVQIYCAWAETVLGETSFDAPVK